MDKIKLDKAKYSQLEQNNERFQRINDYVPIVLYDYVLHPDGSNEFLYVSSNCEEVLELTEAEMLNDSASFWNKVHEEDIENLRVEDIKTSKENSHFKMEFRFITKSGKTKWIEASSNPSQLMYDNTYLWSGYCLDITEKKELEIFIKNELEVKDKFLSILSHDIRTPLGSLLSFSDLLLERIEEQNYSEIFKFVTIIKNTSEQTFHFFDNLLAWTRTQHGAIQLNPELHDLNKIIEEVIALLKASLVTKEIELQTEFDASIKIIVDKNIIKTVLRNILSNAVKFTHVNGKIIVSSKVETDSIKISIQDNGIGMSYNQLNNLLKLDKVNTEKGTKGEKGYGLGLILCKEFIKMHNGTLNVNSELGYGSTFTIGLPL